MKGVCNDGTLHGQPDPARLVKDYYRASQAQKKDALQPKDALQNFHQESYLADADVGKSLETKKRAPKRPSLPYHNTPHPAPSLPDPPCQTNPCLLF